MFSSTALVIIAVAVVAIALGLTVGFVIGVYHVFRTEQQEAVLADALAAADPFRQGVQLVADLSAVVDRYPDERPATFIEALMDLLGEDDAPRQATLEIFPDTDEFTARMAATSAEIDRLSQRLQPTPECDGSDFCYALTPHPTPEADDPRPCKGRNGNVCVAEGCCGEACRKAGS